MATCLSVRPSIHTSVLYFMCNLLHAISLAAVDRRAAIFSARVFICNYCMQLFYDLGRAIAVIQSVSVTTNILHVSQSKVMVNRIM